METVETVETEDLKKSIAYSVAYSVTDNLKASDASPSKNQLTKKNKLAKLEDAIAISKSETITHSLIH